MCAILGTRRRTLPGVRRRRRAAGAARPRRASASPPARARGRQPPAGRAPAGSRLQAVGRAEGRILPGRDAELGDGIRMPPAPLQDDPEVVVNEGAIAAATSTARKSRSASSSRPASSAATPSREALGEQPSVRSCPCAGPAIVSSTGECQRCSPERSDAPSNSIARIESRAVPSAGRSPSRSIDRSRDWPGRW